MVKGDAFALGKKSCPKCDKMFQGNLLDHNETCGCDIAKEPEQKTEAVETNSSNAGVMVMMKMPDEIICGICGKDVTKKKYILGMSDDGKPEWQCIPCVKKTVKVSSSKCSGEDSENDSKE